MELFDETAAAVRDAITAIELQCLATANRTTGPVRARPRRRRCRVRGARSRTGAHRERGIRSARRARRSDHGRDRSRRRFDQLRARHRVLGDVARGARRRRPRVLDGREPGDRYSEPPRCAAQEHIGRCTDSRRRRLPASRTPSSASPGYPRDPLPAKQYRALRVRSRSRCATSRPAVSTRTSTAASRCAPWDYLGGMLACEEAGATVIDAHDEPLVTADPAYAVASSRRHARSRGRAETSRRMSERESPDPAVRAARRPAPAPRAENMTGLDLDAMLAARATRPLAGGRCRRRALRRTERRARESARRLGERSRPRERGRRARDAARREPAFRCTAKRTAATAPTTEWLVDPLDGTANFVHGLEAVGVSIGLVRRRRPGRRCGARAAAPGPQGVRGRTYWAVPAAVRSATASAISVSGPRARAGDRRDRVPVPAQAAAARSYLATFEPALTRFEDIRRVGAASLDLCWTAEGVFDGFFELRLGPWDVAAGGRDRARGRAES